MKMNAEDVIRIISRPTKVWSRSEILSKPSPIPLENGVYAWFFKKIPPNVPLSECKVYEYMRLLYVGISPKNELSSQNLRKRIATHFRGNAEGSTLRRTLGVLLAEESGYDLRRVGSGKRMTLTHSGEQWLDDWMEENAFVVWVEHDKPWTVEKDILNNLSLPLNIQDNSHHEFSKTLSSIRVRANRIAKELPIANEDNQDRVKI